MNWLADLLRDPSVAKIDVDGEDRFAVHRSILAKKPMLRTVFTQFHHVFNRNDERFLSGEGLRIELGAGVAPIRDTFPDVMATDIIPNEGLDRVLDAENLDLPDNSVRVLFLQNCFHHLPHPNKFFEELDRVLVPGGGAIMLEPYYGPVASFLFRRLFHTEGFDKNYPDWETPATGPMNGANQALSYIVFERDKEKFDAEFPRLSIAHQETCNNYMMYLLSGGLNFRQILPNFMSPLISLFQMIAIPVNRWTALHHIVVVRKEQ